MSDTEYLNDKEVTYVSEVRNWENRKLPWYKNADKIPVEDLAEAQEVARQMSDDDRGYEWRMRHYTHLRIGYSWTVRDFYPWFMDSHAEAMEFMRGMCDHQWGETTDRSTSNPVLGTYTNAHSKVCTKCGYEKYERTSYNNWSGD